MISFSKSRHGNDLLTALCESEDKFSDSQSLANRLSISRRSLFYVIKKVNHELAAADLDQIQYIRNTGYFLTPDTINSLSHWQSSGREASPIDVQLLKTPKNNQRQTIDTFLMISNYYPVISSLQELFQVSKNTILNDIRYVKANLPEGLTMVNTSKGKLIEGSEIIKRGWVVSNLSTIQEVLSVPKLDHQDKYVERQLKQFEQITGSTLTGNAFNSLKKYLDWYVLRLQHRTYRLPEMSDPANITYSLSNMWATRFLKELGIDNHAEIQYLSEIVNANQFSYINHDNPMMNKLRPIAKEVVHMWILNANAHLAVNINKLIDNLTVHLVPTYYRCKYHIQYHNPMLHEITSNYQETFQLTKLSVSPLEKFMNRRLSDDEVSLISIYFGSALRTHNLSSSRGKAILVVCSSGIGTSHLLFSQLKNVYPSVNFMRPVNTLELENINWHQVAGIISTLPLNIDRPVKKIQIRAVPSKADWHAINRFLIDTNMLTKKTTPRINIESLMDVISEYARIEQPHQLKKALVDYLLSAESVNINYPNRERFLGIDPHYLQVFDQSTDWKHAVRDSFAPMEKDETIERRYPEKVIQSTIDHGDYMVIGNGIMLAHSGPADGVNQLGIGFNLFRRPFTSLRGQTVNIVITLAPVDAKLQVPFLEVMLKYASDKKWLKKVSTMQSKRQLEALLKHDHLLAN